MKIIACMLLGLVFSTLVSAFSVRDEVQTVMTHLEDGIAEYDNKEQLCKIHSEFQIQALYVISNPFHDFTKFKETNKFCEGLK